MNRQRQSHNGQEPSRAVLKELSELAAVPTAQRPAIENWVTVTLRRYQGVMDFYDSDLVTKSAKINAISAAIENVEALINAPDWLVPEMHGFELIALTDKPMRGRRTDRAFRAAENRIKREQVALARMAKRLKLMRAAMDARPSTVHEALAEKTAAKPHTAWLARSIVTLWMKIHPEDGFRDDKLASLHAFARRLWMIADGLNTIATTTVRTRLLKPIHDVRQVKQSTPSAVVPEQSHPATRKNWRASYVDHAVRLGMDEDSAVEMAASRRFALNDSPAAAAEDDIAALNTQTD